jgi:hypothetical protein
VISLLIISTSTKASAEIYSWVDESGGVNFTDQYSNVPAKYLNSVKVRDDAGQRIPDNRSVPSKAPRKQKIAVPTSSKPTLYNNLNETKINIHEPPSVFGGNHDVYNNKSKHGVRKFRRKVKENTKRSQKNAYDSQSDARKATIDAERQIDKAKNAGQESINKVQQEQQKAQDLINRARNTGTKR